MSEIMFSHQKRVKKPFFLFNLPQGVLFCQMRVSCQTFKMVIQRCIFLTSHFWPFKNHWTCQKSCFLIRRGLKKLFVQSDASNCKVDNDKILFDVSNIAMSKYVWSVPTSVEKPTDVCIAVIAPPPLSNATQNVAVYMAGYLLLKVPVSDCDECSEQLILPRLPPPSQEMSFYTFVHEKNIQRREVLWSFQHWQWPTLLNTLKLCFVQFLKA